jgi:hypothetical protein
MFRRLVFENTAALFTLAAFITAVSIYLTISWRALRMKRPQVERFANLPFETPTPAAAGLPPAAERGGRSTLSVDS